MAFYRVRRRLEDLAEFAYSIVHGGLSAEKTEESLTELEKECKALYSKLT